MTAFVVVAVLMTVGALAWVLLPLLRRPARDSVVERSTANLAVLRDQLAELDADLANGAIAPESHARARAELERRVLEEAEVKPGAGRWTDARWLPVALGVLIPVGALSLYLSIGNPEAIRSAQDAHGDPGVTPEQVERMVAGLAARLEKNPDDPAGWSLLGRSYYAMGRFPEAVAAYAKAVKLIEDDAGLFADYADALAMTRDRRIDENVLVLVNQALKINPDHPKALVMAGTAAYERKDYRAAAGYFERLQRQVPPDTEMARVVAERVADARARSEAKGSGAAPAPASAPAPGARISGRVALSPGLAGKAGPADTVFILARATEGPRMPLAILKRQVKDLPLEFTLSDEQAMAPEMKLSKFKEVVVVARVSKSGGATPQSGDLQGATGAVRVGTGNVNIVIDAVVP